MKRIEIISNQQFLKAGIKNHLSNLDEEFLISSSNSFAVNDTFCSIIDFELLSDSCQIVGLGMSNVLFLLHSNHLNNLSQYVELSDASFILSTDSFDSILLAFESMESGRKFRSDGFLQAMLRINLKKDSITNKLKAISEREIEIITAISKGLSSVEIAKQLEISPATISTHRKRILKKLDLKNSIQLLNFAYSTGLVEFQNNLPKKG